MSNQWKRLEDKRREYPEDEGNLIHCDVKILETCEGELIEILSQEPFQRTFICDECCKQVDLSY